LISELSVLAFTHKSTDLVDLGTLSIQPEKIKSLNSRLKQILGLKEFFLLNTCNRVELIYTLEKTSENKIPKPGFFISDFIHLINPDIPILTQITLEKNARQFFGLEAMNHLLRVSCSLDSMVVGEKEILAQVRAAYDLSYKVGFTGEILRLVMDRIVKTAKEVYTYTKISQKPISVVSIAFRKLQALKIHSNADILIIGAGKTNTLFSKYLIKNGFHNFSIFNRTLSNAETLAKELNGKAFELGKLSLFKGNFDLILVCTNANKPIITLPLYRKLLKTCKNPKDPKVLIDLSVPSGIDLEVMQQCPNHFIDIQSLQETASANMDERYKELFSAEKIIEDNVNEFIVHLKTRKVEMAMSQVPLLIKEIKEMALSTIFATEINLLDESSKETLKKVLNYMEKKYISIPMVLAKEILVGS
jgi:glutamyl-tRNA reductase